MKLASRRGTYARAKSQRQVEVHVNKLKAVALTVLLTILVSLSPPLANTQVTTIQMVEIDGNIVPAFRQVNLTLISIANAAPPPCPHGQYPGSFPIPGELKIDGQIDWSRSCRYTENGYYIHFVTTGTVHVTGPMCVDWSPDQSRQWSQSGMISVRPAQPPVPTMSVMRSQVPGGQNWWVQNVSATYYIGSCPGYQEAYQAPPPQQYQQPPAPPQQTQLGYSPQQPQYQPPAPPPASYQPAPDGTSTQTTSDTVTITVSDTNTNTATASANGNSVTIYFVMPGSCATCPPTVSTTPPPNFVPPASVPQVSQPVPAPPAPPTTLTPPSNLPRMGTSGIAACPVEKSTFTARFEGTKEDNWVILGPNNARYIGPPVNRFTVPNGISLTTASGEELPSGNEFMGGSGWIATSTGCQST